MAFTLAPWRRDDPFYHDLRRDMERMFERFERMFSPSEWAPPGVRLTPPLDLSETKDGYVIRADLPGVDEKDINVSLSDHTVTIRAEKKVEEEGKEGGYLYAERRHGSFERQLTLPADVNADKVQAHYRNGVLELVIPKSEKAKPKEIPVQGG